MTIIDSGWPIPYSNPTKWTPFIHQTKWTQFTYPSSGYNNDIEAINQYQNLQPRFYYDWTLGKNINIWV